MSKLPFASIVTPVYNGERYLSECIDSVLRQRGIQFEHVILDNASTDQSRDIARRYAARDPRIRLIECMTHLPIIANWNRAIGCISDESRYVWLLPADDAMVRDDSLKRMVEIAHRHPTVGIVSSYRDRSGLIQCTGLDTGKEVFSGRDIVRLFMREEVFAFSPNNSLVRRDLIDGRKPFYPERYLHADVAAFFNVLDGVDFGFVHDVLMFSREHDESVTARLVDTKGTSYRDGLMMLREYGPRYFDPDELERIEARFLRRYYRFLVRNAILLREWPFFSYHAQALRQAGRLPDVGSLLRATFTEIGRAVIRPRLACDYVIDRLRLRGRAHELWENSRESFMWNESDDPVTSSPSK